MSTLSSFLDPLKVTVTNRVCLGMQTITGLSTTVPATLTIPAGAVVAEIQADGGVVRITVDNTAPNSTHGYRLDDGSIKVVDSSLVNTKLLAITASINVQIAYFDRV